MKAPSVCLRKSFLVAIAFAMMSASLLTKVSAETVHQQTYYRGSGQSFQIGFFASHYDVMQSGFGSNFNVVLTIIVREGGNVYSSSSFAAVFNTGEVDVSPSEDLGTFFDWTPIEGGSANCLAELSVSAEFNPPGELENYSVEVSLVKYANDESDTNTVYITP